MSTYYKLFYLFSLLISLNILSNEVIENSNKDQSTDHEHIEKVLNTYFEGWLTGNAELVGSVMHHSCHLKFIREGQISIRNKEDYLSGFKPRPRLPNAEGRILAIDMTNNAAAAKIELETETRLFTDYFNLLKENGQWYITDKVSTSVTKG